LRFVSITDEQGRNGVNPSGSWNQFFFKKGAFMVQSDEGLTMVDLHLSKATIAIVPNVRATFYARPTLLIGTNSATEFK
jgi:hypothetical protein